MAVGTPKTRLVNGQRVSIETGLPYGAATPQAAPAAAPAAPPQLPTTPVRLTPPSAYETTLLGLQPRTQLDIQGLVSENRKRGEQYLASMQPSGATLKIGEELANIRKAADDRVVALREGQETQYGLGRPLQLSVGRANKMQQNEALQQEAFASQERNLITRLGIAQQADQMRQEYARAGMSMEQANTNLLLMADQRQREAERDLLDRAKYLDQQRREEFADVLDFFRGADPDSLSPEERSQLQEVATRRGLPFDLVMRGLEVEHTRFLREQTGTAMTVVDIGGGRRGVFNPATGEISPIGAGGFVSSGGEEVVAGYDITDYATDPQHGQKVQAIYNNIPDASTAGAVDAYIDRVAPSSPITGQMVLSSAQKHGVDPKLMLAIMQQDSAFGTRGRGAGTFNPGNVGNDDDGNTRNYGNWPAGVDAVADWLSRKYVGNAGQMQSAAANVASLAGENIVFNLPQAQAQAFQSSLQKAVSSGDYAQVRNVLVNGAINVLDADDRKAVRGRIAAVDALEQLQADLDAFAARGGNTGLVAGTSEGLAQRLGRTTDPELAKLGAKVALSIQAYRKAISGAAFTPSESAEYERVFPSTGNVPALNAAKIAALSEAFHANNESYLGQVMGSPDVYREVMGLGYSSGQAAGPQAPAADDPLASYVASLGSQPSGGTSGLPSSRNERKARQEANEARGVNSFPITNFIKKLFS